MASKLTLQQQDVLRLCDRTAVGEDGFSKCARQIYEALIATMPAELIDHRMIDGEHFIRLTDEARTILNYIL